MTTTLAQRVVAGLKGKILAGDLPPGHKLPSEAELIGEYGVSRTVIREAVSRLRAEGLVETFQGRGSFVLAMPEPTSFTVESAAIRSHRDVLDMLDFRLGIECEAAALAAARDRRRRRGGDQGGPGGVHRRGPRGRRRGRLQLPSRHRGRQRQPVLPRPDRLARPDDDHASADPARRRVLDDRPTARRAGPARARQHRGRRVAGEPETATGRDASAPREQPQATRGRLTATRRLSTGRRACRASRRWPCGPS